ncbi:unnamed protein product [Tilletia controversa]|nr:unnamed protein product [Tilletia controversa]CAD6953515.1 unnamed protein product [Tilletia controversa]CAD6978364.1 unnamed protein product [Tilletia controversa]CAD6983532.1 unnamed protein product [Tilletia controversa]
MDRSRKRARSPSADLDPSDPDGSTAYRSRWDRGPAQSRPQSDRDRERERERRRAALDPDQERYQQRSGSPGYEAWLDEQETIVYEHERNPATSGAGTTLSSSEGDWADESDRGRDRASMAAREVHDRAALVRRISDRIGSANGSSIDRYVPSYAGAGSSNMASSSPSSMRRYDESDSRDGRDRERGRAVESSTSLLSTPTRSHEPARDPLDEESLLSFKAFCTFVRMHDSSVTRETTTPELYEKHQAYKREFNRRAIERFWREHRHEAWFRERYGLEEDLVLARKERRRKGREGRKETWLRELRSGLLDPITFDAEDAPGPALQQRLMPSDSSASIRTTATAISLPTPSSGSASSPTGDQPADISSASGFASSWSSIDVGGGGPSASSATSRPTSYGLTPVIQELTFRRHGIQPSAEKDLVQIPPEPTQILLMGLPTTLARKDVDAVFEGEPGFRYVAYGEVNALKRWTRIAWVMFEEGTDVRDVVKRLDKSQAGDFPLSMSVVDRAATGRRRVVPEYSNSIERLTKDLDQAKRIVATFEADDRELFADLLTPASAVKDTTTTTATATTVNVTDNAESSSKPDVPVVSAAANDREPNSERDRRRRMDDDDDDGRPRNRNPSGPEEVKAEPSGGLVQDDATGSDGPSRTKPLVTSERPSTEWLDVSAAYEVEKRCQTLGLGMDVLETLPEDNEEHLEKRRQVLKKHLDLLIDLLRVVYHCDYYLGASCDFPEELVRRVPRHVRKVPVPWTNFESPRDHTNDESWAKNVDLKANLLVGARGIDVEEHGGKNVEKILLKAAEPYVQEESLEKFRCSAPLNDAVCHKAFKAALFVQKHVMNKHRAVLDAAVGDEVKEALELNQLALDPGRVQLARISDYAAHGNGHSGSQSAYNSPSARSASSPSEYRRHGNESSGTPLSHRLSGSGSGHHPGINGNGNIMNMGMGGPSNGGGMNLAGPQFGFPGGPPPIVAQQMAAIAAMQFGMPLNPAMIAAMAAAGMKEMARNMGMGNGPPGQGSMGSGGSNGNGGHLPNGGVGGAAGLSSHPLMNGANRPRNSTGSPRVGPGAGSLLPSASGAGLPARPQLGQPRTSMDSEGLGADGSMQPPPAKRAALEPLPTPPSGPDPRARRSQRSYEDLDGAAASGEGDVQLQY